MNSKGLSAGATTLALSFGLAGCGEDLTSGQLVGTWEATEIVFINDADRNQQVDLHPLGYTLTWAFTSDGRYELTVGVPGSGPRTEAGSWEIAEGRLVVRYDLDPDPVQYDASISGSQLTAVTTQAEYDFDDNQSDDPADLRLVAARQP